MPSQLLQAGTNGWFTVPTIAKHRLGVMGPDGDPNNAPYSIRIMHRTGGDHVGHLALWEYDQHRAGSEWMLVVFDEHRNLIGQELSHTKEGARKAMNKVFAAKGLGVYSTRSSDAE